MVKVSVSTRRMWGLLVESVSLDLRGYRPHPAPPPQAVLSAMLLALLGPAGGVPARLAWEPPAAGRLLKRRARGVARLVGVRSDLGRFDLLLALGEKEAVLNAVSSARIRLSPGRAGEAESAALMRLKKAVADYNLPVVVAASAHPGLAWRLVKHTPRPQGPLAPTDSSVPIPGWGRLAAALQVEEYGSWSEGGEGGGEIVFASASRDNAVVIYSWDAVRLARREYERLVSHGGEEDGGGG